MGTDPGHPVREGGELMANPGKILLIEREIQRLREIGENFSPATIAGNLGLYTKEITEYCRQQPDLFLVSKATDRRMNNVKTTYSGGASEPIYFPSVWGFRQDPASQKKGAEA